RGAKIAELTTGGSEDKKLRDHSSVQSLVDCGDRFQLRPAELHLGASHGSDEDELVVGGPDRLSYPLTECLPFSRRDAAEEFDVSIGLRGAGPLRGCREELAERRRRAWSPVGLGEQRAGGPLPVAPLVQFEPGDEAVNRLDRERAVIRRREGVL